MTSDFRCIPLCRPGWWWTSRVRRWSPPRSPSFRPPPGSGSRALIHDETGSVVARVDFLFRQERVVIEFDGAVKYGGGARQGQMALVAEKRREDSIRRLGYVVVRLTWADLSSPERVGALVRAAMRFAAA